MRKREIYQLTKHCSNKEQIKKLVSGENRKIAFDLLKSRQDADKRKRRDSKQLDDYLSLPLHLRAKKFKLKLLASKMTGMYGLRIDSDFSVSTEYENLSPFPKSKAIDDCYNRNQHKNRFNEYKWMGGCYNAELRLFNIKYEYNFSASASTFNNHTSYWVCFDFDKYTFENIGGLTTFYLKNEKKKAIKEIYWLHFYGHNGYYVSLKKGWLIKGYHVEKKEDFSVEKFCDNLRASDMDIEKKSEILNLIARNISIKNASSIYWLVKQINRYHRDDQKYEFDTIALAEMLRPFVPNTHKIKTVDDAIAFVKKQRSIAANKLLLKRVDDRFDHIKGTKDWITYRDSISAGNCDAGTRSFIRNILFPKLCEIYGENNVVPVDQIKNCAIHRNFLEELGQNDVYVKRILSSK